MRVTQKDIALKLGLSRSLVSAVLDNRTDIWASEATRTRIKDAALEMNYRHNQAARRLRSGRTHNVGLVCRLDTERPNEPAPTIGALSVALASAGYELTVRFERDQKDTLDTLSGLVHASVCDGYVVWNDDDSETEAQAKMLETMKVPFVVKGRFEATHPDWYQVDFAHDVMMGNVVNRFVASGHTRIFYMGYAGSQRYKQSLVKGYVVAMRSHFGAEPAVEWIRFTQPDLYDARKVVEEWLSLSTENQPTAIVVGSGTSAWQAIELSLARRGRVIGDRPGDMSVAGIGLNYTPLIFGKAMAYQGTATSLIAGRIGSVISAILDGKGEDVDRIQRITPELTPLPELGVPIS